MTTYRIRDWSKHFENNRTRGLKELRFVVIPNKHDGDGYTELLDHPNGAAHYAAWVSLIQVTSKGRHPAGGCGISAGCCECRGTLLREGAKPHDPASLSRLTRIPASIFEEALPRLVNIGWLQTELLSVQEDSEPAHPPAVPVEAESRTPLPKSAASIEWNGTEENGMERKKDKAPLAALARQVFGFWQEHLDHQTAIFDPKRGGLIIARLKEGYTVERLRDAVRGCKLSDFHMGRETGKPAVHDDIALICRDAAHVDMFIGKIGTKNGANKRNTRNGDRPESDFHFQPKSVTR